MLEIIEHSLEDSIKLLPFLFIAFLIIEFCEHKLNSTKIIQKSGKFGPIIGSLLGAFPQCGFSVLATNLYVARIISLGTLIAIYLSTSDEMLPILIAEKADISIILNLLLIKVVIGMVFGFIIDLIWRKKETSLNYQVCEDDHCDCEHHFVLSSIKHTLKTFVFILIITFILNTILHFLGDDFLKNIFTKNNFFTPFIAGLIGLIPNCAASITITELYLNNILPLAGAISGLLSASGVALIVLFKSNKNLKENLKIVLLLYGISVFTGLIFEIFSMI